MSRLNKKYCGYTLVEMLITLALSTVIIAGVLSVSTYMLKKNNDVVLRNQINSDLHTILMIMAQDIRRAGYWNKAEQDIGTGKNTNPFMRPSIDLVINKNKNCILYAYDKNQDSKLLKEYYGFRLNHGSIQEKSRNLPFHCDSKMNVWENLTDSKQLTITTLRFDKKEQFLTRAETKDKLGVRTITITISGHLTQNPTITQTVTQKVLVANPKYYLGAKQDEIK